MIEAPTSLPVRARLRSAAWSLVVAMALVAGPTVGATQAADPTPSAGATASATATADPSPTSTPAPLTVRSVYRSGSFVRQYTSYQCVGASMQTMRNIVSRVNNRDRLVQRILWLRARRASLYTADGGADPFGWTTAVGASVHRRYVLVAADTMQGALRIAARGMALTHRPAGIVVWRGSHAWVLTGFDATADPATTTDFTVVAARIADPLYPYYHVWHRTIYRPTTRLATSVLASNYSAYHDARRDPRIEGKWVAIVPLRDGDPLPDGAMTGPFTPLPRPTPSPTPSPSASATSAAAPSPTAAPTTQAASTPAPTAAPTPEPTASPTPAPTASPEPSAASSSPSA